MHRSRRYPSVHMIALLFVAFGPGVRAQSNLPPGHDLQATDGVEFVLKMFDRYPIVAITDMPGCQELHQFLRTLVQSPDFRSSVIDHLKSSFSELLPV